MPQDTPLPTSLPVVRLLPLTEGAPNEGLANALARLLIDDESQAESGAQYALLILTGIQTFYDTGGNYVAVERLWEPFIVSRQMEKAYGEKAWEKAAEMAEAARKVDDQRGAWIYQAVASMLKSQVNKPVDSE